MVAGWKARLAGVALGVLCVFVPTALADENVIGDLTVSGDIIGAGGLDIGSAVNIDGNTSVGGNLAVTGDIEMGGNITGVTSLSVDGTASFPSFSCPKIRQEQVFRIDGSMLYEGGFGDSIGDWTAFPVAMSGVAGTVEKVVVYVDKLGAGWDSLTVDVFRRGDADTSMLTVLPAISPSLCSGKAPGDWVSSEDCGRAAAVNETTNVVSTSEVIALTVTRYGYGTPPTGLVVWVYFKPSY